MQSAGGKNKFICKNWNYARRQYVCVRCTSEVPTNELISDSKAGAGSCRWYSDTTAASRLSVIEVETRVLRVCNAFDKVTADKVCKFLFYYIFRQLCGITVSSHRWLLTKLKNVSYWYYNYTTRSIQKRYTPRCCMTTPRHLIELNLYNHNMNFHFYIS